MSKMTPMRARFVREYLVDLDVRAALERAGYNLNANSTYGWKLLKMPVIAEAVREAMEARAIRTQITADRVLAELAAIAFSDIGKVASWRTRPKDGGGDEAEAEAGGGGGDCELVLTDSADIEPATRRSIAKVRRYTYGAVRVEMHDKLGALHLLARHLGLFGTRDGPCKDVLEEAREAEQRRIADNVDGLNAEQRARLRASMKAIFDEARLNRKAAAARGGGAPGSQHLR